KEEKPDWVIVENVKGIIETEGGYFFDNINKSLQKLGYTTNHAILNAVDFGVPQIRNRVFIVGSMHGLSFKFPKPSHQKVTVNDAISDLPSLKPGANFHEMDYRTKSLTNYQRKIKFKSKKAVNNLVSANNALVVSRYKHIPQGGNWESIPS